MTRSLCHTLLLTAAGLLLTAAAARADLDSYLKRDEPKFAWKLKQKSDQSGGTLYDLEMTSQVWQDIPWTHRLQVFQPKDVAPSATMLLWNTGGGPSTLNLLMGMDLAQKVRAPVAFLYDIPNQPLFDGKKEDALIAETFVRTLEKKDFDWPLLLPMVKSVVKAMDVLQAFAKEEWKTTLKTFVISGASKRGWTAWLTGAAQDPRVAAIAPMVIDTLNMQEQMAHQKEAFGAYSEMIRDYTLRGLVPLPPGDDARKLWQMVDPYSYRDRLTMPKLLINGNNDPYWTVDALNLYWDGLKGDKYVTYVPNAGHGLRQFKTQPPDKSDLGDLSRARDALVAFVRSQMTGKPMPRLSWKNEDGDGKLRLVVACEPAPLAARLWAAEAPTRDFRKSAWRERALEPAKGKVLAEEPLPKEGFRAFWAELEYEIDGIHYTLSTQIRVVGAKKE